MAFNLANISHKRALLIAAVACAALFTWAYANSLHNSFHFDDDHVIERNLHLRDLGNIPKFFTDARTFSVFPQNATYRPLVSTSLAIDYAIGRQYPVPYHVTQLLLFACVGALFFYVAKKLFGESKTAPWVALGVATLFCVHTGNTQPGNYISARSELLCAIGVLGAYAVYLRWPKLRPYGVYLIPMVLGALAKPPAVVFAGLLFLHKAMFEEGLSLASLGSKDGWRKVGGALLGTLPALVVGALVFRFVEGMNPEGQTYGGGDRAQYLWTQAFVWLRYIGMFFLPTGLTADTDIALLPTWKDPWVLLGFFVCAGSIVLALFLSKWESLRPAALGVLWFWIGVLPTSLVPLAEVTNDHRPFLGFLGLCLVTGTVLLKLVEAKPEFAKPVAVWMSVVLLAHAVGTHVRNKVWRTEETLWADVVVKSPKNGRGWMNYGLTQMRKGETQKAKELFERAAALVPNYPVLEINRGIVRGVLREPDAERYFLRALELAPEYAPAHYYYARHLIASGKGNDALRELQTAIRIDGGDPNPRHELMNLLAAKGDREGEKRLALETLALGRDDEAYAHSLNLPYFHPAVDDANGWYQVGLGYTQLGEHALAAQAYRQTLLREEKNEDAWNNLGWSLYTLGFVDDARIAYQRAIDVNPANPRAANNLKLLDERVVGRGVP